MLSSRLFAVYHCWFFFPVWALIFVKNPANNGVVVDRELWVLSVNRIVGPSTQPWGAPVFDTRIKKVWLSFPTVCEWRRCCWFKHWLEGSEKRKWCPLWICWLLKLNWVLRLAWELRTSCLKEKQKTWRPLASKWEGALSERQNGRGALHCSFADLWYKAKFPFNNVFLKCQLTGMIFFNFSYMYAH